jgi:hypothetical protein
MANTRAISDSAFSYSDIGRSVVISYLDVRSTKLFDFRDSILNVMALGAFKCLQFMARGFGL